METKLDEIASRIYRLSTFVPNAGPNGLQFNQFLVDADEPLIFHCGPRRMFPLVSEAVAKVVDVKKIRWITFSHIESDECGSFNNWMAAAPNATPAHGRVGCMIWLNDMVDQPRQLADGEVIDLGGKRMRRIDTPHVPHCWDAGLMYEETTGTLFCGDLFTQDGNVAALTEGDIVGPSIATEDMLRYTSVTPNTASTIRRLAALKPKRLAAMHGSSYEGEAGAVLNALADYYDKRLRTDAEKA